MTMKAEVSYPTLISKISVMLGQEILSTEEISGGLNSKIFRINADKSYVAKLYFNRNEGRSLQAEFSALRFLWDCGVRCVPEPIYLDEEFNLAIYEFIEGEKIKEITISDMQAAINFLSNLQIISKKEGSLSLLPASSACFSLQDVVNIINRRLDKLTKVKSPNLQAFLINEFKPTYDSLLSKYSTLLNPGGSSSFQPLPQHERTLSPSDFGFHNALRKKDGTVVFLDFEYFGWDDPAKMVADFLHHPGMRLDDNLKLLFVNRMLSVFNKSTNIADNNVAGNNGINKHGLPLDIDFTKRLEIIFPFIGLIWCLIILNEFNSEDFNRRMFANYSPLEDQESILNKQLKKSRDLLLMIPERTTKLTSFFENLAFRESSKSFGNSTENKKDLFYEAKKLRHSIIKTVEHGGRGHIPSALSLVEILVVLYHEVLQYKSNDPRWKFRDRFILSKGHGCLALYGILADRGFFPKDELLGFCKYNSRLGGHPEDKVPGVEVSTGSLGHGLSIGVGFCLNALYEKEEHRTFVVIGDGESNEGSIWEAAMCASKHKLDNLVVMVDYNKHQSSGPTSEILELEPFADKWRSFGFAVMEVDGHNIKDLQNVFSSLPFESGKPNVIICHTIKGKGIPFIENNLTWHHKSKLKPEEIKSLYGALESTDSEVFK